MDQLIILLYTAFGNNFTYYLKTHNYHWTVLGPDFPQYHKMLQHIYEDAQAAIDDYAEQLRRLGVFPKGDYRDIMGETELTDAIEAVTDPVRIWQNIAADLDIIINTLQDTFDQATGVREYGLQNFLADRINEHRQTQWMVQAILADSATADTPAATARETSDTRDTADACPVATQDIAVNLKNRQTAIDKAHYGPLDPAQPNKTFWAAKARMWSITADEARTSRCGNCAAFNQTTTILDCIDAGLAAGGSGASDAWSTIQAGDLGYCEAWDFKCAASRTCDAWIAGGPIH